MVLPRFRGARRTLCASKPIIIAIGAVLAEPDSFTGEELDVILNRSNKYRLGSELEVED
jgi:hypothetical protein